MPLPYLARRIIFQYKKSRRDKIRETALQAISLCSAGHSVEPGDNMQYIFTPERVCSKQFFIDIDDNTRAIKNFEFKGGCPGNANGISRLIRGMKIDDVIERFADMPICPSSKVTSCPEQLRKALIEAKQKMDSGEIQQRPHFGLEAFSAVFGK